jgi:hypothetical protein
VKVGNDRGNCNRKKELQACKVFNKMEWWGNFAQKYNMKNQSLLSFLGHAPVQYGRYYSVPEFNNHRLWLCPVTEYVFGGGYPDLIWVG